MKSKIASSKEDGCKEVEMQYKLRSKTKSTSNDDLLQKKTAENIKLQQVSYRQGDAASKTEKNQVIGRGRKSVSKRNKDVNENEKAELGKPKSASVKIMRTRGNLFPSSSCVELSRDELDSPDRGVPEHSTDPDPSCRNLPQKPVDKKKEQHDCMKIKASFWVLNDDIIRAVQQKLRTSENQTIIRQQQENAQPKLTTRRSFPESRASAFRPRSAGDAAATKNLGNHSAFQRFDLCLDRVDAVVTYGLGSSGNSENTELVENDLQQMLIDAIITPTMPEVSALNSGEMIVHSEISSELSFPPGHGQDLVFDVSEKIGPVYVSEVSEIATQNEGVATEVKTMTTVVPEVELQVRSPVALATSPEMTSGETAILSEDQEIVREMSAIVTESSEDDHDLPVSTTIIEMSDTSNICTVNKQSFSYDESMEEDLFVNESDACKLASVPQNTNADQENSSDDDHDAMGTDFEEQTVHSDNEISVSSRQHVCVSDASGSSHKICKNVHEILEVKQTQESDFETGPHFPAHFDTYLVRNTEAEKSAGRHNLSIASRSQDCASVKKYECENIDILKAPLHVPTESPRKTLNFGAECSITNNILEGSDKDALNHGTTICVPREEMSHSTNDLCDQDRGSKGASMQKSVATCSKRIRKRRPKIKFTWKKMRKCQAFQPSLTRLMSVGSSDDDSWNFQRPITDQVLSGCAKISPDVENAASVLAMMKGNLFSNPLNFTASSTFKSKTPNSDKSVKILSAARIRPRMSAYFCDICGHASEQLDLLKKHMLIHGSKHDVNKERLNLDENSSSLTESEIDCETNAIDGETVDLSQPSQSLSMVLRKQNVPKLIINMRIEKISKTDLTNSPGGNADLVKHTSIKVSRKVLTEALKEIVKDNFMSCSRQKLADSASKSSGCRQVPVHTKSIENISENVTSSEVEKDSGTISCEKPSLIEIHDDSSNEQDSTPTMAGNKMDECNETSKGENDSHNESITVQESSSASDALEPSSNIHMAETTKYGIKISQLSDLAMDVNSCISDSGKNEDRSLVLNPSTCLICNHQFSSPANMRKHVRMKHNLYRPHKCPTCGKGFPYPSSLEEHMIIHSANPKRMQICDMCGKDFVRASGLRKHVKEHHENSRPHICHICEKGYIYLSALKEHLRSHSEDRTFKCSQCDSEFKHASNLLTHMKKAHRKNCSCPAGRCACFSKPPKAETTVDCEMCSRTFSGKRQLKIHMRIHGNKAHLVCKLCNTEFPNKFLLTKHRLKHKEVKSYDCVVCSRSFLSYQSLKIHLNGHNGIKPYQCENCGKQYSTKSSLKIHSVKHTDSNLYACGSCNKKFAIKKDFTDHACNGSKGQLFICNFCNERFKASAELRKHLMIHEEQKKFVCLFCSKKFLHESNLRMHIVKHTGERPHSCSVCGRCFSLKTNLKRHMQLHRRKNGHIIAESAIPIPGAYVILGSQ